MMAHNLRKAGLSLSQPINYLHAIRKRCSPRICSSLHGSCLSKFTQPCINQQVTFPDRCSPSDTWLGKEKDFSSKWTTALYAEVLVVFCSEVDSNFSCMLFWLSSKTWDLVLIQFWHHHRALREMNHGEVWGIFQRDKAYPETPTQLCLHHQHLIPQS